MPEKTETSLEEAYCAADDAVKRGVPNKLLLKAIRRNGGKEIHTIPEQNLGRFVREINSIR